MLEVPDLFFQLFLDVFGHGNIRDGLEKHKPRGTAGIRYPPKAHYTTAGSLKRPAGAGWGSHFARRASPGG